MCWKFFTFIDDFIIFKNDFRICFFKSLFSIIIIVITIVGSEVVAGAGAAAGAEVAAVATATVGAEAGAGRKDVGCMPILSNTSAKNILPGWSVKASRVE